MEVQYKKIGWKGEERLETESLQQFVYNTLLYREKYSGSDEKIRLEDQPKVVCEAIGRLIERLLEKNILDLGDLKYIVEADWGLKASSLMLFNEAPKSA